MTLPTPGARDGDRGPRSDEAILNGTGQRSLLDIGKLLAVESGELKVKLLPTPTTSDSRGAASGGAHNPNVRVPRMADGNMTIDEWDESRRSQYVRGVGSAGPRGDSLGAAVARAHEGVVDDRPDFTKVDRTVNEELTLFPTPGASDGNGGKSPKDLSATTRASGAKRQACLPEVVKLLPTKLLIDSVLGTEFQLVMVTPKEIEEMEDVQGILPTPKTHQRGDCPSERERNSPDLAAVKHHFPEEQPQAAPVSWGKYEPAVRRWERLTRPAPAPTEPNKNGNPRLTAAFSEWMMGWPLGWVSDPAIGVPRTGQLRVIGNGVCPQQAFAAITGLLDVMKASQGDNL